MAVLISAGKVLIKSFQSGPGELLAGLAMGMGRALATIEGHVYLSRAYLLYIVPDRHVIKGNYPGPSRISIVLIQIRVQTESFSSWSHDRHGMRAGHLMLAAN